MSFCFVPTPKLYKPHRMVNTTSREIEKESFTMSKNFSSDQQLDCTQPDSTDSSELCQLKQDIMECVRRDGFQKKPTPFCACWKNPVRNRGRSDPAGNQYAAAFTGRNAAPDPGWGAGRLFRQAIGPSCDSCHVVCFFCFTDIIGCCDQPGSRRKRESNHSSEPASLCDTGSEGDICWE